MYCTATTINFVTEVQYLNFDCIQEGVGASQVLSYVERLAKKWNIELVNFEKDFSSNAMPILRLEDSLLGGSFPSANMVKLRV